jgi:hypothetical protein
VPLSTRLDSSNHVLSRFEMALESFPEAACAG